MARSVTFTVPGTPRPWKRPSEFVNRKTGHIRRIPDPETAAHERTIARIARLAWKGPPTEGPVILRVRAIFEIPTSWPQRVQKAAREARVMHIIDPDLDRIINLVQDALVGIVYVDDNQVCGYAQPAKRYGSPARTEVTVQLLDQQPDEIAPAQRRVRKRAVEQGLIPADVPSRLQPALQFPPNVEKENGRG